jgi:hypothetical protein
MEGTELDEIELFRRIGESGARALLIGRRALVALGLPVLTADYDFWVDPEDIALFNAAALPFGLVPSHTPDEARVRGRDVLENDERSRVSAVGLCPTALARGGSKGPSWVLYLVDVIVARFVTTVDGQKVFLEDLWTRRVSVPLSPDVSIVIPCLDDLVTTKRFAARAKDLEDIRLLLALRESGGGT